MILAGDVGATKILLEVGEERRGRWRPLLARRYAIDDYPNVATVFVPFTAIRSVCSPSAV